MEFYPSDVGFVGTLPDGTSDWFESQKQYEDAFWDMIFDMNNAFDVEMPEDYVA